MGLMIENGKGGGPHVEVDTNNRLRTLAVSESLDRTINEIDGKVWSVPFENIINAGADDYIIYVKNTGSVDLHISSIRIACSAATQVEVHAVTGTAGGSPTAITAVPRKLGSSQAPTADLYSDPDITGLTSDGTLFFIQCPTADKEEHLRPESTIVIPKSKAIAILIETTTITCTGVISLIEGGADT